MIQQEPLNDNVDDAVNIFVETHEIEGFKTANLTRDLEVDLKVEILDMS